MLSSPTPKWDPIDRPYGFGERFLTPPKMGGFFPVPFKHQATVPTKKRHHTMPGLWGEPIRPGSFGALEPCKWHEKNAKRGASNQLGSNLRFGVVVYYSGCCPLCGILFFLVQQCPALFLDQCSSPEFKTEGRQNTFAKVVMQPAKRNGLAD